MTNGIIKIEVGDFLIQPIGAIIEPIIKDEHQQTSPISFSKIPHMLTIVKNISTHISNLQSTMMLQTSIFNRILIF
jgi:hypothetical protein